jgi:ketosteroid isomerase-like protein
MPDSLESELERLRAAASKLNQLTDYASASVRSLEDLLNKEVSAGVYAHVEAGSEALDEESSRCVHRYLAYSKLGQGFRIAIEWWVDGDDSGAVKAWQECTREDKLETFPLLPKLLKQIANNVEQELKQAEASIAPVMKQLTPPSKKGSR